MKISHLFLLAIIALALLTGCRRNAPADTENFPSSIDSEGILIELKGTSATCNSKAVQITEDTVTITREGTYILTGTLDNGSVVVDIPKKNTLHLILNNAAVHSEDFAALYILHAKEVSLTLAADSRNILSNGGHFSSRDKNDVDAVLFSRKALTFNGEGTLTIQSPNGHGIKSSGSLQIDGGAFFVDSLGDSFHSKAALTINGGAFEVSSGDDAFHCDERMTITAGDILITESHEGLEGGIIDIQGGSVTLTADDDGINAGGKLEDDSPNCISISGGRLHINAAGDGLDSNGNLFVSGGEIYISGPTDGENGALDYDLDAVISGGTVVAAGSSAGAKNFGPDSTQGSILAFPGSQPTGSSIQLADSSGQVLVSWQADKDFDSVVISCGGTKEGEVYTLTVGDYCTEIVMEGVFK